MTEPSGSSTAELAPNGNGTMLRLTHRDYLVRLCVAAAGGDPGPDPWVTGET